MFYQQLKFQTLAGRGYIRDYGVNYSTDTNAVTHLQELIRKQYLSKYSPLTPLISKSYSSKKDFDKDIKDCLFGCYNLNFKPINKNYVIDKVEKGEIYLFEIRNKDKTAKKNSRKNIHTHYFETIFSDENKNPVILKLNSEGIEIFRRRASIDPVLEKRGGVEVIKNRRYTQNKILFHLPIILNMSSGQVKQGQFNRILNARIAREQKVNIIGIDRGEKNLLYYYVINPKGEIRDQGSLNEINSVNYRDKLIEREKERLENRQSWKPVAKIKDLKKGYISHVIHKICQLIEKHNAIVVLEDLNMRFKQIRSGIERSVYQQFEKALIDKLGYLVFKDNRGLRAPGGVLNGYQLSAPFISFEKMGKQTGILFYTQAEYTSKTDPLTGFRKNIYISNSDSQDKIKEVIKKIDAIGWNEEDQSYFFKYNPVNLTDEKYKNAIISKEWTVYSKAPRIRRQKGEDGYWKYDRVKVNEEFEKLLNVWNFVNPKATDIKQEILNKEKAGDLNGEKEFDGRLRSFWHSFIYLFNLVLELRNSFSLQIKTKDGKVVGVEEGIDFIASPVEPFFTTSNPYTQPSLCGLAVENADANGAYNIARKGVMILKKIREHADLFISIADWDAAAQDWGKYVGTTAPRLDQ